MLRILTPVLKFRSTRDARKVCGDALEMRGGIGYVEEFASARLLRDAHLGSIWEGTGNIIALDAITRAIGRHHAEGALAADLHARLQETPSLPAGYRDQLKGFIDRAIAFSQNVASKANNEADARRATSMLYHTASAVMLAWEGERVLERRGDARRFLLSKLVVDHHLSARDPFAASEGSGEQAIADLLLNDAPVTRETAIAVLQ